MDATMTLKLTITAPPMDRKWPIAKQLVWCKTKLSSSDHFQVTCAMRYGDVARQFQAIFEQDAIILRREINRLQHLPGGGENVTE